MGINKSELCLEIELICHRMVNISIYITNHSKMQRLIIWYSTFKAYQIVGLRVLLSENMTNSIYN